MRIGIVCLLLSTLIGCGGYKGNYAELPVEKPAAVSSVPDSDHNAFADQDRELSYTVEYRLETSDQESVLRELTALVERFDGYVLEATKTRIVFRLRAEFFNEAITGIEALGVIDKKQITGTDFSDRYTDLTRRLETMTASRQKYLDLLARAQSAKEIDEIKKELERLQLIIEQYEAQLFKLDHLIQYASFTVETSPGVKPGPVGWAISNMFKGVKKLFVW